MRISLLVPSKKCIYLDYLLTALREQSKRPSEIVLVLKDCNVAQIEKKCQAMNLPCTIIEQTRGYVTTALNLGKKAVSGDFVLITDDDAIPPRNWVAKYFMLFTKLPNSIASVSSRDIYVDVGQRHLVETPDDKISTRLYRKFVRSWIDRPIHILLRYRHGVYINTRWKVSHGPCIPEHICLSLPLRGVNMALRGEVLDLIEFPEHPALKRALGFEQYIGLQLVLNGYDGLYVPHNPVLHIHRKESLSRTNDKSVVTEINTMSTLYKKLVYTHFRGGL